MKKLYSQIMGSDNFAFTSGQIAMDENKQVVGKDDIKAQTAYVLENVMKLYKEVGFEKHNIVSLTIFLSNIVEDFAGFNEAYGEFFDGCAPARATVQATLFNPDYLIEIQVMAHKDIDNRK